MNLKNPDECSMFSYSGTYDIADLQMGSLVLGTGSLVLGTDVGGFLTKQECTSTHT
jgi:hypothetical protein